MFFQNAPPFHIGGLLLMTYYFGLKKKLVLFTPEDIFSLLKKTKQYDVGLSSMVYLLLVTNTIVS